MKLRHVLWLLWLLPILCFGQDATTTAGALSFNPPPTDVSTTILSNIFGIVGNLLHGTGSQIIGEMFRVFNAAVLTIGGILLFYILIVSTLNTSAEGEVLGRKWKSIWIPIRAVFGIVLLVPQASGYCLAQVFVMWLVMQGVGAGDLIWNTSLDYLSRGGVISAPNLFMPAQTAGPTSPDWFAVGATALVPGPGWVVAGTEAAKYFASGSQAGTGVDPAAVMKSTENIAGDMLENTVCTQLLQKGADAARQIIINVGGQDPGIVPDLMSSINFPLVEGDNISNKNPRTVSFPNVAFWNLPITKGLCGSVTWAPVDLGNVTGVTAQGLTDAQYSRSYALQSMLDSLSDTATTIVNAFLTSPPQTLGQWDGQKWVPGTSTLNGLELINASLNYLGMMQPTFNLIQRGTSADYLNFINDAKTNGWIMAGSYFNNLAQIQRQQANLMDESGKVTVSPVLSNTSDLIKAITSLLPAGMTSDVITSRDPTLASYLGIISSNNQTSFDSVCKDTSTPDKQLLCYIVSAKSVVIPTGGAAGQINLLPFQFNFGTIGQIGYVDCDWYDIPCHVENIGIGLANTVITAINYTVVMVFQALIFRPLTQLFVSLFNSIYTMFNQPGNPILTLASAGNTLLTSVGAVWAAGVAGAAALGAIPAVTVGPAVIGFAMPILNVILMTIFATAIILTYYIPLVPYIVFTLASIGWIIAVIESMVAAPIVALGLSHPEGHEVFGKAEQAVMLVLNIFLRPAMMIIGFIIAIILSYISIWLLNQGFIRVTSDMMSNASGIGSVMAPLAAIAIYVVIVMMMVQKAFALIHMLPDKILRWLSGGQQASFGEETASMVHEVKQSVAGGAQAAGQAVGKGVGGVQKAIGGGPAPQGDQSQEEMGEGGGGGQPSSIQQAPKGPGPGAPPGGTPPPGGVPPV